MPDRVRSTLLHIMVCCCLLKVLKNDKRAIFTAASQASKAHAYIMDLVGRNQIGRQAA